MQKAWSWRKEKSKVKAYCLERLKIQNLRKMSILLSRYVLNQFNQFWNLIEIYSHPYLDLPYLDTSLSRYIFSRNIIFSIWNFHITISWLVLTFPKTKLDILNLKRSKVLKFNVYFSKESLSNFVIYAQISPICPLYYYHY